jgi:hypothetical protein
MNIDHGPAIGAFRDEPLAEGDEVLLVGVWGAGGIVDGWGAQNDLFGPAFKAVSRKRVIASLKRLRPASLFGKPLPSFIP